jgi:hypothetical protein
MNDEFERMRKEVIVAKLDVLLRICLEGLSKPTKNFRQDNSCTGRDSKPHMALIKVRRNTI